MIKIKDKITQEINDKFACNLNANIPLKQEVTNPLERIRYIR